MAAPQPWHQLCKIREDVRTGTLTLDEFAADLHAVRTGEAPATIEEALTWTSTSPARQRS